MVIRKSDDVLDAEWQSLEDKPLSKQPPQRIVPARQKSSRRYHAWVFVFTNSVCTILFCLSVDSGFFVLLPVVMCIWTLVAREGAKNYLNSK